MATPEIPPWSVADNEASRLLFAKLAREAPTPPTLPNPPDAAAHRNRWLCYLAGVVIVPMLISLIAGSLTIVCGLLLAVLGYLWFVKIEQPSFYNEYNLQIQNYNHLMAVYQQHQAAYLARFREVEKAIQEEVLLINQARIYQTNVKDWWIKKTALVQDYRNRGDRLKILEQYVLAGFAEAKIKRDVFGSVPEHQVAAEFRQYILTIPNVPDWGLLWDSGLTTIRLIIGDGHDFPPAVPPLPYMPPEPTLDAPPPKVLRYCDHPGAKWGVWPDYAAEPLGWGS